MNLKNMVSSLLPALSQRIQNWDGENIQTCLIFGSFANGKANLNSDLDLLVILKEFKYKNNETPDRPCCGTSRSRFSRTQIPITSCAKGISMESSVYT